MSVWLESITICNFKSFLGEITIPVRSFTAIVGPNGSGKSNIIDAIRFVMGDKASALRVNRFSELVHGANIGKPRMEGTHVKIVLAIGDKERSFKRIIHGEDSQYNIDDKIVGSDFYMTELKTFNLDVKSRNFFVGQGYVEYFASKSPKQLTAIFETISGSNEYKEAYEKLTLKDDKIKNKMKYAHQIKKQLLTQRKHATMEQDEARKYLQLQEQYMKEKSKFQLVRLFLIKKIVETLQAEKKGTKLQIDTCLCDKRKAMLKFDQNKSKFKSLSNSLEAAENNILELESIIQEHKAKHVVFEENILHFQRRRDCTDKCLRDANKEHDKDDKVTRELKDMLGQVSEKLAELGESQDSFIELSNSQVERYMDLKSRVECQAKHFIEKINSLKRQQQIDDYKLENENRRKQELEEREVKLTTISNEDLKKRLEKLKALQAKFTEQLNEKKAQKQKLSEQLNISLNLENEITQISKKLHQADQDVQTASQQKKKEEILKELRRFSGVHGRLSHLCKPIHSRYNVAVTKVFGKNIDAIVVDTQQIARQCIQYLNSNKLGVETFLPLDSIKTVPLKENLRDIRKSKNVKLLYDVLNISSAQMIKAILFATKNTLVCETAEDARIIAYKMDKPNTYDCVSLDGCFYRKNGTFSGGQADLIVKTKQWEKQQICALKERQKQLKEEFRSLSNISANFVQSEIDENNIQIEALTKKKADIETEIKNTVTEINDADKELSNFGTELSMLNSTIAEIQHNMQGRNNNIESIERNVNAIANEIFATFCEDINVPDISYYENNNLRIYQELENKRMELKMYRDRIQNQLIFEEERKRDIGSKVLKWKQAMKEADAKLKKLNQQEHFAETAIEQKETELLKLRKNHTDVKKDIENITEELAQCRQEIGVITQLYLKNQRACDAIQRKIEQKKAERDVVLKECKMENITIPTLRTPCESEQLSSTMTSNTEASSDFNISMQIDFSQFPEDICNNTEENLQNIIKPLEDNFKQVQNKMEKIKNPNLEVVEKVDSTKQQLKKLNREIMKLRQKSNEIKRELDTVKKNRHDLFSNCLERVNAEIEPIYKNIMNDTSAIACVLSDNSEEPYIGGINYHCLPPFKRYQPVSNLSGGEQSLASLALLFAIQRYKSMPFFIMDESDAALDNTNIKNLARFTRSEAASSETRLIIITLQKLAASYADILLGVTTDPDAECTESKIFSISLDEY